MGYWLNMKKGYLYLWFIQAKKDVIVHWDCVVGGQVFEICTSALWIHWTTEEDPKSELQFTHFFSSPGCGWWSWGWRSCHYYRLSGLKGRSMNEWHFFAAILGILALSMWHLGNLGKFFYRHSPTFDIIIINIWYLTYPFSFI